MNDTDMMKIGQLKFCRLNIQLTRKCNQRCKSCNSYNYNDKCEISYEVIENTIKQACERYNINNIAFTGGEPTLRKNLLDILSMANKYCKTISITTNGSYINSKEDALKLINSGVSRFTISYHGCGFHDEFVGIKDGENRVKSTLAILSELKKEKQIEVKVGMLISDHSIHTIEEMIAFCREKGFKLYLELPDDELPIFKDNILAKDGLSIYSKKKLLKIIEEDIRSNQIILISDTGKRYIEKYINQETIQGPCPLGYTDIYIASTGDVYSGCWVMDSIGNVNEEMLVDIMDSPKYVDNLRKMLQRKCPNCTCGYLFQSKYMKI